MNLTVNQKGDNMKKMYAFGTISLVLLTVLLSGCQKDTVGQAAALNKVLTKQDVLDMLNKCTIYTYEKVSLNSQGLTTADKVCKSHRGTCTAAEIFYDSRVGQPSSDWVTLSTDCNVNNDPAVLRSTCCST